MDKATKKHIKQNCIRLLSERFFSKIEYDWGEKFESRFGRFPGRMELKNNNDFVENIHSDITKYLNIKNFIPNKIDLSSIKRIIDRGTISLDAKFDTLHIISGYLGYNDWYSFESTNESQIEIYSNQNPNIGGDELTQNSNPSYFVYYYADNDFNFDKALLVLEGKHAKLAFFHRNSESVPTQNIAYAGKIYPGIDGNVLSIFFETRTKGDDYLFYSNPSFCCLHKIREDLMLGVFGTSGNTISCGIIAAEKTGEAEYMSKIIDPAVPAIIQSIIYNSRFIISGYREKDYILTRKEGLIRKAKEISGVYEGYTFLFHPKLAIQRLALEIFEDGNVNLISFGKQDGEKGRILDLRNNRNLVIQFKHSKTHNYYKIQIVLDLYNRIIYDKTKAKALIGVYGGIEESFESPMGGRIILFPSRRKYDDIKVERLILGDENDRKYFNEFIPDKAKQKIIVKFLRGELDNNLDPPNIVELSNIFQKKTRTKVTQQL